MKAQLLISHGKFCNRLCYLLGFKYVGSIYVLISVFLSFLVNRALRCALDVDPHMRSHSMSLPLPLVSESLNVSLQDKYSLLRQIEQEYAKLS